jgi:LAO/AO transport system kinase
MTHVLAERVLQHDTRAIARLLRLVDDRSGDFLDALKALYPHTGRAHVVGITGNPGAGKSTLTDRLIEAYRAAGKTVSVLCVDPSSPYSGGAILGDRIRMTRHATDEGVFIRSIATRGHLGGLSRSARDMVRVCDAAGFDLVLVETVGVGQDELEITRTAHTTVVVSAPGLGDDVQAIKAGLLETADVFVVNKADREGADGAVRDLELMIALGNDAMIAMGKTRGHGGSKIAAAGVTASETTAANWVPPILKAIASRNQGVTELAAQIDRHRAWVAENAAGQARMREREAEAMRESLREALIDAAEHTIAADLERAVEDVVARRADPYTATESLVAAFRAQR